MYRGMFLAMALVGLIGTSSVQAHDASLHKGKPTKGEVVSLADDGLKLKTATGTTAVTFRDETKFERGEKKARREDIKEGDQLTVFGTKLPTGELVAREVLLPTAGAKTHSHAHSTSQNAADDADADNGKE